MFCRMNEQERHRLIAAHDEWRAAERAYSDEAAKYVQAWWVAEGPPDEMPQQLTREALDTLTRLRAAADEARNAYYEPRRISVALGSPRRPMCWASGPPRVLA